MSERNTGISVCFYRHRSGGIAADLHLRKNHRRQREARQPEKLFIQFVAAVVIQERGLNNYTGNQNIPSRAEGENLDALAELFYVTQRPGGAGCGLHRALSHLRGTDHGDPHSCRYARHRRQRYADMGDGRGCLCVNRRDLCRCADPLPDCWCGRQRLRSRTDQHLR